MDVEETWGDGGGFAGDTAGAGQPGGAATGEVGAAILSAADAERHCEELREFDLREVGSPAWVKQHKVVNQLNLQAHHCVRGKTDNFVLESLVTFDKIGLLIRELLLVEAWRVQVFPRLKQAATRVPQGGLRLYFIHYHEVALVNLLEILLFHDYAAEAAGDAVLELVDYCSRKVAYLTATGAPDKAPSAYAGKTAKEIAEEIAKVDPADDIQGQAEDIDFRCAVVAVFILRFLTAHVSKLSVTVMTRMLDTHDLVLAMVPLIENPPWVRKVRVGGGGAGAESSSLSSSKWAWEKYDDHVWAPVKPENLLTMSRCEGQPWLVLYNLLCDGECRKFYTFTTFRKDQLLRVRKYLNDTLKDQLPVLTEVQRYMDELVIMQAPPPDSSRHFIVQQVPAIRNSIIKGRDWADEAQRALGAIFPADGSNDDLKQLAEVFTADGVAELMGERRARLVETVPRTCTVTTVDADGQCRGTWVYELLPKHAEGAAVVDQDTSAGRFRRFTLTLRKQKGKNKKNKNKKSKMVGKGKEAGSAASAVAAGAGGSPAAAGAGTATATAADDAQDDALALPADCVVQVDVACEERILGDEASAVAPRPFSLSTNTIAEVSQVRRADLLEADGAALDAATAAVAQLAKVYWRKVGSLDEGCVAQLKFQLSTDIVMGSGGGRGSGGSAAAAAGAIPLSVYKFGKTAFVSVRAPGP